MEVNKYFSELRDKEDALEHYGILGMKWGIRRYQPYSTRGRKSGKGGKEVGEARKAKAISKNKAKAIRIKNKKIIDDRKNAVKNRRTLSDAELNKRLSRLQTEKKFKDLTSEDVSPGKTAVKRILATSGITLATLALTSAGKIAVRKASGEEIIITEYAKYFKPKK